MMKLNVGMDSRCCDSVGGLVDSTAVWITIDPCLCSRQTLALYFSTYVCASVSFFLLEFTKMIKLSSSS